MMLASIVFPRPTSSARMARPPMSRSTRWATSIWWGSSLMALASRVIKRSNPGTSAIRSASRRSSYQARSAGGCLSASTNSFRDRSSTAQESSGSGLGSVTRCLDLGGPNIGNRAGWQAGIGYGDADHIRAPARTLCSPPLESAPSRPTTPWRSHEGHAPPHGPCAGSDYGLPRGYCACSAASAAAAPSWVLVQRRSRVWLTRLQRLQWPYRPTERQHLARRDAEPETPARSFDQRLDQVGERLDA